MMCKRYILFIDVIESKLLFIFLSLKNNKIYGLYIPYEFFKDRIQNLHYLIHIYFQKKKNLNIIIRSFLKYIYLIIRKFPNLSKEIFYRY